VTTHLKMLTRLLISAVVLTATAHAQPVTPTQDKPASTLIPLKVEVVIARYQGQKLISSMPYSLTVNANDPGPNARTSLRMGAEVPVSTTTFTPGDGKQPANPMSSYSYRSIGTLIDCSARSNTDGRYILYLSLEESAVYGEGQTAQTPAVRADTPAFRSFKSTNSLVLKNGETTEYTTATDRVTAEVVKVSVKLTVL